MNAESTKRRAFISLLKYAIIEEYYTSRRIFAILKEYENEEVWDTLFGILIDTEKHKIMLNDVINLLNFDEKVELEDANLVALASETQGKVSDILEDLLATEKYFQKTYRQILRYFENEIELILDIETSDIIRKKLEDIIDDETRHVDILSGLIM
ncbi:MAG: ferritin-like domain-containing protein [Archaeoglobi archaeon]|nr:ferritin-like domain-containing protein [Archaeoglobi archaeon]